MKRVVNCFKFIGIFLSVLSLAACPGPQGEPEEEIQLEKGVEGVEIPAWDISIENGMDNLPALKFDGSSNFNDVIKENVEKPFANIEVKNVIFMFFDGLTKDLVSSAAAKYNGNLMLNCLPVKMDFTAPALNENTDTISLSAFVEGSTFLSCLNKSFDTKVLVT